MPLRRRKSRCAGKSRSECLKLKKRCKMTKATSKSPARCRARKNRTVKMLELAGVSKKPVVRRRRRKSPSRRRKSPSRRRRSVTRRRRSPSRRRRSVTRRRSRSRSRR